MLSFMEKTRITIEVREDVRRALASFAAMHNKSVGQIIDDYAISALAAEVEKARAVIATETKPPETKKGRPPKAK